MTHSVNTADLKMSQFISFHLTAFKTQLMDAG